MTTFVCRNADGSVQFDASSRLAKIYGSLDIPAGGNGTVTTNIDTSVHDIWFYLYLTTDNMFRIPPAVSLSGNVLSYSGGEVSAILVWGAY
ncbi:hypothetical protein LU604_10960 [Erwinia tracheiphila]|uniref:Uncharacterized protein n=2 Tax=Erwinia tracheiphila TaxID=65700 RepID=A0A345CRH7_9GAMM|nr:hypothetical protein [Erwinia tracheiphila]AXF76044.1 hypothetical protein AV903_08295 [Erwinia tracheiphila]UIA85294.1 hypothetical protein LU604_10960 [Erwinia tracheiphila]